MAQTRKKSVPSVKTQMKEHIADFGWCRANQHIWQNPNGKSSALRVEKGVLLVTFICANCDGRRHDNISLKTGELLARHYAMPQGYVLKLVGDERPTKSDWRREHYRDLLAHI